jgi:hypothetical protein
MLTRQISSNLGSWKEESLRGKKHSSRWELVFYSYSPSLTISLAFGDLLSVSVLTSAQVFYYHRHSSIPGHVFILKVIVDFIPQTIGVTTSQGQQRSRRRRRPSHENKNKQTYKKQTKN